MSPRPYRMVSRQASAERTRARVLRVARTLLTSGREPGGLTLDRVAKRAGVARMTVYHQFGSRRGLLEAVFDSFAEGGDLPGQMAAAFREPDPLAALDRLVSAFARFWSGGRRAIRRVHALAVLDPELGRAVEARNARRREAIAVLVERVARRYGKPVPGERAEVEKVLQVLTSFEIFDALAGPGGALEEYVPSVQRLARAVLGVRAGLRRRSLERRNDL